MPTNNRFRAGQKVIVERLPEGFLDDLPKSDKRAISSIVGKAVLLVGIEQSRVELQFHDDRGDPHSIFLDSQFVKGLGSRAAKSKPQRAGRKRSKRE